MIRIRSLVGCALLLTSPWAVTHAKQDAGRLDDTQTPVLTVTASGDPVEKSYRRMMRGIELFEKRRAMAPSAHLRFKVLPRRKDVDASRVSVEIVGDTVAVPLPIAADSTFVLERIPKAWEEDSTVQANRKTLTMTWRAEIRTPGVPAGMRRLGDLRLECAVGMEAGLVSNVPSAPGAEHCNEPKPRYFFFAERPLFSVSLVSGSRKQTLPVDMMYANALHQPMSRRELARCDCEVLLDRAYYLPLGDTSWPDDTLLEYEYMDERPVARIASVDDPATKNAVAAVAIGKSTRADVILSLGRSPTLRFESGFEVWAYRFEDLRTSSTAQPRQTELAILFAPSGIATKTRIVRAVTEEK